MQTLQLGRLRALHEWFESLTVAILEKSRKLQFMHVLSDMLRLVSLILQGLCIPCQEFMQENLNNHVLLFFWRFSILGLKIRDVSDVDVSVAATV